MTVVVIDYCRSSFLTGEIPRGPASFEIRRYGGPVGFRDIRKVEIGKHGFP